MTLLAGTCSYARYLPSMGVPVRTSVGHPRGWPWAGPLLLGRACPWGLLGAEDWRPRYRARLDRDAARLTRELRELADGHAPHRLVLLCFCVARPACHLSELGAFLVAVGLADEVPELR